MVQEPLKAEGPAGQHHVDRAVPWRRTCLTFVYRPCPISRPPLRTRTEPSAYTCTEALIAGGATSNLHVSKAS